MNIVKKTEKFLSSLGKGYLQVANNLRKMKIKGKPKDETDCPLAIALKKKFKLDLCVTGDTCKIYSYQGGISIYNIALPLSCQKFIENFDNLKFKDLIE